MTTLAILLDGKLVAHVERNPRNVYRLTYVDEYVGPESTPISLSFPPQKKEFVGAGVEDFLWGLLPESEAARKTAAALYGADTKDPLSLLAEIGHDCAGAIQLCESGQVGALQRDEGSLVAADVNSIELRLAELRSNSEPSWLMADEHWSLPGMQEKFGIRWQDDKWWWAYGSQPTTHIVKPGVRDAKHQALVEYLSMRAAHLIGLNVANVRFLDFKSERAIVIERFDRLRQSDGRVSRLHQEDLCQALGIEEKYEDIGGPNALQIVQFLRDSAAYSRQARENVDCFVDALIYNTIIAAPDAHARNYGVFLAGDEVALTPLYDVATSLAYGPQSGGKRVLAMSIAGEFDANIVGRSHWRMFAQQAGLDEDATVARVVQMSSQVPLAFEHALKEMEGNDWDGQVAEVKERLMPSLREHIAAH